MKKIAVLGSTGSIGTQTLDVIRNNADKLQVLSLVAFSRKDALLKQVEEFSPQYYALISEEGEDCLIQAVKGADIAVIATKGITALKCVIYCLQNGVDVALANKEVLVCAGEIVMPLVGKAKLYPIDSEHCAINQCINSRANAKVSKILLTASGGPFWNCDVAQLTGVTAKQALNHPNWSMGSKITIDSATMMNKSLEVLEASWLFDIPVDQIEIVVHRQSIVHSMVSFADGSAMAQLSYPDMRLPIQIALLGNSGEQIVERLNFQKQLGLTFEPCNFQKFPCAKLAYEIKKAYPLAPTVMNGANDVCVEYFLAGKLSFDRFYFVITSVISHFTSAFADKAVTVESVIETDVLARDFTQKFLKDIIC